MVLRVLHLVGSPVDEFHADLSRLYAADCLSTTADPSRYDFRIAHVDPGGSWSFPTDLGAEARAAAPQLPVGEAIAVLTELAPDVVLPQMFCRPGMTSYRALFDVLGIPLVGNTAEAMALTAHKARAKAVVAAAGVRVPRGEVLRPGQRPTSGLPAVVKPVDGDNSAGVALVRAPEQWDAALEAAFATSDAALVEDYVPLGREVRVGVLERDGELVVLPLEEYAVSTDSKPVRLADDKLARSADGQLGLVAKDGVRAWVVPPGDPVEEAVHEAARRCHVALGCRHYSLFDLRIDPDGEPWFLEASLYCSFARTSVVSVMAQAAGISTPDLLAGAIAAALAD